MAKWRSVKGPKHIICFCILDINIHDKSYKYTYIFTYTSTQKPIFLVSTPRIISLSTVKDSGVLKKALHPTFLVEFNELIRLGAGAVELQALAGGDVPWEWMVCSDIFGWPFFFGENQQVFMWIFQDRLPVVRVVGAGVGALLRSWFEASCRWSPFTNGNVR